MSFNLDAPLYLYSIPAVWLTAFAPATIKFLNIKSSIGYDNLAPRSNAERLRTTQAVEKAKAARFLRMDGAHQNGNENFPIWIAAVLAGHVAGLPNSTMNTFSIGYFSLRVLYDFIYINQTTEFLGNCRTAVFFAGLSLPLTLLFKAANKLAQA